jgi:hypothetical protein
VREAIFPKMTVLKEEAAEDVSVCVVSGLELGRLQVSVNSETKFIFDF